MDNKTTFGYWVKAAPYTDFKMRTFTRPAFVGSKETPENLNQLTIGQLIELSQLKDNNSSFYTVVDTVLGMDAGDTDKARAVDVVRFVGWVFGEVKKINELFAKNKSTPTQEQRQAGIETLNFGLFGMLDWYAQRMGIADHDTVLATPWLRIYKCLDMDTRRQEYDRRLQKIQADNIRRQSKT